VRLVTWNCCSGPLDRKLSDLATLEADIAVVPECPRIPEQPGAAGGSDRSDRKNFSPGARTGRPGARPSSEPAARTLVGHFPAPQRTGCGHS